MQGSSKKERIRLLDILRGFAVLGTLGTNIWLFAHLGDLSYILTFEHAAWWASFDDFIRIFTLLIVNGKLLGLLTILFGVGLELKYQQSLRKGYTWPGVYIWTSMFLMIEGFIHYTLVMEYDILMSYGATAIIVAWIVKRGDQAIKKAMHIIGGLHVTIMLLFFAAGIISLFFQANMTLGSMSDVVTLYQQGSWWEQVIYRLENVIVLRMEPLFVIPMNIFLFLLGVRMMRAGVFSPTPEGKRMRKKLLNIGVFIGLPFNLFFLIPGGGFDLPVRYLFAPLLSLGYIALIAKLVEWKTSWWLWGQLEQVGKMSLSCYVFQNLISTIIFYGWGFGLGGKVHAYEIVLIWFAISFFQLLFATVWLRAFPIGPIEMLRKRGVKWIIKSTSR